MAAQRRAKGAASGGAGALLLGGIADVVPLLVHVTSQSVVIVDDQVMSSTFHEWVAVVAGGVAVACGIAAMVDAPRRAGLRGRALAALVALVGAYHLARGAGLIGG